MSAWARSSRGTFRRSLAQMAMHRSMPTIVAAKFAALAEEIAASDRAAADPQQVAEGFLQIAVANMANAIKQVSVQKGHDATALCPAMLRRRGRPARLSGRRRAGMETVFIHPFAGVLRPMAWVWLTRRSARAGGGNPVRAAAMPELRELADAAGEAAEAARWRKARIRHASRHSATCICAMPAPRPR